MPPKRYYLSLFSVVRGEDIYVREWVSFHISLGVEHIFLVENSAQTSLHNVIGDFVNAGFVTLYRFPPRKNAQKLAFNKGIEMLSRVSRWVGFFDVDEFVFPINASGLPQLLRDYEAFPALAVNWVEFGFDGKVSKPDGWVIENFLDRAPLNYRLPNLSGAVNDDKPPQREEVIRPHNTHVKCFVQPKKTLYFRSAHHFRYQNNEFAVNENFQPVEGPFSESVNVSSIRVNHYWSKSREELAEKLSKGRISQNSKKKLNPYNHHIAEARGSSASGVRDMTILRHVEKARDVENLVRASFLPTSRKPQRLRIGAQLWAREILATTRRWLRRSIRKVFHARTLQERTVPN